MTLIAVDLIRALGGGCGGGGHGAHQQSSMSVMTTTTSIPVTVCCNTRDAVDAAVGAIGEAAAVVAGAGRRNGVGSAIASVSCLHSDQTPAERAEVLAAFRALGGAHRGAHRTSAAKVFGGGGGGCGGGANVLVMTDTCMPSAAVGEAPLGVPLLVNHDLPRTKEAYARRVRLALGGGGSAGTTTRAVVNIVASAEAKALRAMESVIGGGGGDDDVDDGGGGGGGGGGEGAVSSGARIEEMPIDLLESIGRQLMARVETR